MLHATIRKESKYYHQQKFEGKTPIPFPVSLRFDKDPLWPVEGGVGGCYTLYDVDLWVKEDEELRLLPMHTKP